MVPFLQSKSSSVLSKFMWSCMYFITELSSANPVQKGCSSPWTGVAGTTECYTCTILYECFIYSGSMMKYWSFWSYQRYMKAILCILLQLYIRYILHDITNIEPQHIIVYYITQCMPVHLLYLLRGVKNWVQSNNSKLWLCLCDNISACVDDNLIWTDNDQVISQHLSAVLVY